MHAQRVEGAVQERKKTNSDRLKVEKLILNVDRDFPGVARVVNGADQVLTTRSIDVEEVVYQIGRVFIQCESCEQGLPHKAYTGPLSKFFTIKAQAPYTAVFKNHYKLHHSGNTECR